MKNASLALLMVAGYIGGATVARGDIYVLANDSRVQGEIAADVLAKADELIIRTVDGATVTLDRANIKQIIQQTPDEMEYERVKPTYGNTLEEQWKLAEWCREKSLTRGRQAALERVLEFDPNHREARLALGYSQMEGRWVQREQLMQERGFVRYKGEWRLPQEMEVLKRREKDEQAQREWFNKLRRLRGDLDEQGRFEETRDTIRGIADPYAAPALIQYLNTEAARPVRTLYVDALAKIATSAALKALANHSLEDRDDEIRDVCLERLADNPHPDVIDLFVAALRSPDNERVNRAGVALGRLGVKSTSSPLIDALVTTHKFTVTQGSGGQMSAGFSGDGSGGFSMGSGARVIRRDLQNQDVLDALVAITRANFGFDVKAWKNWQAAQRKPVRIDTRRD